MSIPVVIKCECGAKIGYEIEVAEGVTRLQIGGMVVQSAHGACAQCGREFHWSLSEKLLSKLIQHVLAIS